jgi:predicted MFS family arabinose efflux permease
VPHAWQRLVTIHSEHLNGGDDVAEARTRVTFRDVFAVAEFRALWFAELLSMAGDQLARVALSVMVFTATGSATLTGLTYALTFAPSLIGGVLLTGIADRVPRRAVLVCVDTLRAGLILAVAIPGLPFWSLCVLVSGVSLLQPLFKAAQLALLPDVLGEDRYPVGMAVRQMTIQASQLVGFAGGGLLVAALQPPVALVLDAATFAASAVLVRFGVRARAAARASAAAKPRWTDAFGLLFADRGLRVLVLFTWLVVATTVYEGLAAPYVHELGGDTAGVGLLLAGDPLGGVICAYLYGRFVPDRLRNRLVGPLAVLCAALLCVCALRPGLAVSFLLCVVSGGLGTVVVLQATVGFTMAVPDASRGQVLGLSNTGLNTIAGVIPLLGGVLADRIGAAATIAWFGLGCAMLAIPLAVAWRRTLRAEPERWTRGAA